MQKLRGKGRLTEDGPLPAKYDLTEMPTDSYPERTKKNIRESDGTLILSHGMLTGGSEFTLKMALKYQKPLLPIDCLAHLHPQRFEVGANQLSHPPVMFNCQHTLL